MRVSLLLCLTVSAVLVGHTEAGWFKNVVKTVVNWAKDNCQVNIFPLSASCSGRRRRAAGPRVQIPPFGGSGGRFGVGAGGLPTVNSPAMTEEGPRFPCSSLSLTGVTNIPKLVLDEAFRDADDDEDGELTYEEFQAYDFIIDTIEECIEKKNGIIPQ